MTGPRVPKTQLELMFLCPELELIYQYVRGSCLPLRMREGLIPVPSRSHCIFLLLWYHIPNSGWVLGARMRPLQEAHFHEGTLHREPVVRPRLDLGLVSLFSEVEKLA